MNKPISPRDASTAAEPTDRPRDLDQRQGEDQSRSETPAEPDRQAEKAPKHDVLELRSPEPKTDDHRDDETGNKDSGESRDGDHEPKARRSEPEHGDGKAGDEKGDERNAADESKTKDEPPPKAPPKIVFVAVALVLLACLAWGAYSHWRNYSESKQTTADTLDRPVEVRTVAAQREDGPMLLTLPGETDAFDTASIFARATGYISERKVDIGSRVRAGDLLLHIAAPDLDNQLFQAQAQLGQSWAALAQSKTQVSQAEANLNLAKVTFARTNQLTQQGYESQQNRDQQAANVQTTQANLDNAKAGVSVAEANIKAQQATVDRLKALTAFEDVRAPFDGVITSRNVDTGDLVSADANSGTAMFTMARDSVIRVTARVPQNAATGILNGLEATVHVPQMPDHVFTGRVARTSGALLYSSRSLTVEVDVPNPDAVLRSGLYVTIDFKIPREHPNVNLPAEALIFNQLGMQVATVEDGKAKMHSVTIFRDHGTSVELRDGIDGGERVILSPPATLADGGKVKETKEEDAKKDDANKGGNAQGGDTAQKPGDTNAKSHNEDQGGESQGGGKQAKNADPSDK